MLKPSQSSVRVTNSHVKWGTRWLEVFLSLLLVPIPVPAQDNPRELVVKMVQNELASQKEPRYWMYLDSKEKRGRTEVDQFAGRQNHFEGQHVGGGKAILEAVRPTGVFRYIASDRAHRLRRRIRRVEVTCRRHPLGNVGIDHARFHRDALVRNVRGQYVCHARKADHDAPVIGQRSP